jgi:hypothetical protein
MQLTNTIRREEPPAGPLEGAQVHKMPEPGSETAKNQDKRPANSLFRWGKRLIAWYTRSGLSNYVPTVRME